MHRADQVERELAKQIHPLVDRDLAVVFYDLTTVRIVTTRLWPPARGEVVSLCYVVIVVGDDVVCDGGGDAGWGAARG